ncbi:unannotated protein [freshwater metagenome]|uniref:Unannotated protein n=1 Tax=freshwater metagenome TaxID=449393 RepID=A0A6J6CT43_9ZZZZ
MIAGRSSSGLSLGKGIGVVTHDWNQTVGPMRPQLDWNAVACIENSIGHGEYLRCGAIVVFEGDC